MTRYGYARVSTKDQKLDRQIEALVNAGVSYGHIYKDKVTGAKDGDRTQQKRLFKKMKAGDDSGSRVLGAPNQIDQAIAELRPYVPKSRREANLFETAGRPRYRLRPIRSRYPRLYSRA